jgi:hypothetical protein
MTVVVVCSGFVGRYIYTAIPRTSSGDEMQAAQIQAELDRAEGQLQAWLAARGAPFQTLVQEMRDLPIARHTGIRALAKRRRADRRYWQAWEDAVARLSEAQHAQAGELAQLLATRHALQRQIQALTGGYRLMAAWHAMHVPLAVVLFLLAFAHAIAALYFS